MILERIQKSSGRKWGSATLEFHAPWSFRGADNSQGFQESVTRDTLRPNKLRRVLLY
jgi:hypothetical protein